MYFFYIKNPGKLHFASRIHRNISISIKIKRKENYIIHEIPNHKKNIWILIVQS